MNKNKILSIILALFVLVLISVGIFYAQKQNQNSVEQPKPVSTDIVSNEIDIMIRDQVIEFGSKLKNVSLLMSPTDVKAQMKLHYGPYLTSELLAAWQNNPARAIGRSVSSPWPDRIEVVGVAKQSESVYVVEGNVIEITSADAPMEPAAIYPVTLTVKKVEGQWLVSGASKGAYSQIPQRVNFTGLWECLPHKDTSGPQTMECAFGMAVNQSDAHYALDMHLLSTGPVDFRTGTHIRVEGVLVPSNQLNSDLWEKYSIDGIVAVTSIQEI